MGGDPGEPDGARIGPAPITELMAGAPGNRTLAVMLQTMVRLGTPSSTVASRKARAIWRANGACLHCGALLPQGGALCERHQAAQRAINGRRARPRPRCGRCDQLGHNARTCRSVAP